MRPGHSVWAIIKKDVPISGAAFCMSSKRRNDYKCLHNPIEFYHHKVGAKFTDCYRFAKDLIGLKKNICRMIIMGLCSACDERHS